LNYYRKSAFLGTILLPIGIILLLNLNGLLEIFNRKLSDIFISMVKPHHTFSKDVVIVDIDENSLALYSFDPNFGRWPWKRSVYPSLISYIEMGNPEMILFDILFTENSPEDYAIVQLNETYPNISHAVNMITDESKKNVILLVPSALLGTNLISESLEKSKKRISEIEISKASKFKIPDNIFSEYEGISFPTAEIGLSSKFIHVVNIIPDKDGVLRRFSPFVQLDNLFFPTLPLVAVSNTSDFNISFSDGYMSLEKGEKITKVPIDSKGFTRVNFYSPEVIKSIPRYSASGLLYSLQKIQSGEVEDPSLLMVPYDLFKDKIVIIGTSAAATHDDVVTPFGLYPGVIAQAVFTSNMREGHFLNEIDSTYGIIIVILLIILSTSLLFFYEGQWVRIFIPIIVPTLYILTFYLLLQKDLLFPTSAFIIGFPISYIFGFSYLIYTEGKDKRKFNSILRNLVDPSIVSHALQDIEVLREGGEWEITAFFSDVAGFSSISEELTPKQLALLLNEYLSAMTEILKNNYGTLDKYIGDAIVGIFGAPLRKSTHAVDACTASLIMVKRMEELRKLWNENNTYTPKARNLNFRIGLNCGIAKVGFMGTESLASYTMMGDMVNLAARLETAAKDYGTKILVSDAIYATCKDKFYFRYMDKIRVKGKEQPVEIYSLESFLEKRIQSEVDGSEVYFKAFQLYLSRNFEEAIKGFEKAEKIFNRKDKAITMLIERCNYFSENPPPENWDGVYTRTIK